MRKHTQCLSIANQRPQEPERSQEGLVGPLSQAKAFPVDSYMPPPAITPPDFRISGASPVVADGLTGRRMAQD